GGAGLVVQARPSGVAEDRDAVLLQVGVVGGHVPDLQDDPVHVLEGGVFDGSAGGGELALDHEDALAELHRAVAGGAAGDTAAGEPELLLAPVGDLLQLDADVDDPDRLVSPTEVLPQDAAHVVDVAGQEPPGAAGAVPAAADLLVAGVRGRVVGGGQVGVVAVKVDADVGRLQDLHGLLLGGRSLAADGDAAGEGDDVDRPPASYLGGADRAHAAPVADGVDGDARASGGVGGGDGGGG